MEFEQGTPFTHVYVRYWKNDSLVRVLLCRFSCLGEYPKGHFGSLARLFSALSSRPSMVGCSGCPISLLEQVTKAKLSTRGILRPFRFETVSLTNLLPKPSPCVFGAVDFYSVLQYLVVLLGGSRHQAWILEAPHLSKVLIINLQGF